MGFSWADEVEKEEEEAKFNRKPNPFGAARPREVVLEEKGVDWQKLDRERELHSNLRKETTSKANTHIKTVSVSKREQLPPVLRGQAKMTKNVLHSNMNHCVQPLPPNSLIPPLKYPPKNISELMQRIRKRDRNGKSSLTCENSNTIEHPGEFQVVEQGNAYMNWNRSALKYPGQELMSQWPMEIVHGPRQEMIRSGKKKVLQGKHPVRQQRQEVLVDLIQHNFDGFVTEHGKQNSSKCGFVNASDKIVRGFTDFNLQFIKEPNAWRHHQHNCTKSSCDTFDAFAIEHGRKNSKCGYVIHSTTSIAEKVVTDSATIYNNKKRGILSAHKRSEGKHARR
ncbi:hypothetical protein J5N97_017548 [Dioscorea zingiberensis]|uniref:Uncharacterized protein n=1 Tax=Dioscorea zingiberensis TaxID=325984 RepID=A0A9D5CLF0_9LILI|nr:hypothetical protein J5N97_017548 [Dioscorea zingiberensis]